MSSDCERLKERVVDFVTGIMAETEKKSFEHHLRECPACRTCAESWRKEEELLAEFFSEFDSRMDAQEGEIIKAVNQAELSDRTNVVSVAGRVVDSRVARRAFAAAVVVVVVVYFTVTLTWISQINLTCQSAAEVLKLPMAKTVFNQQ
jgi:anti-sigma factor RsiW